MADKPTTSAAKELGPEFQADSLNAQEPIRENFQNAASQEPALQVEATGQGDKEKAQSGDGSKMISEEGSRHDMNPPEQMRREVDSTAFEERLIEDGLKYNLKISNDDLYKEPKASDFNKDSFIEKVVQDPEFDKKHENASDYENDM